MDQILKKRLKIAALIVIFLAMSLLSLDFTGITGALAADVDVSSEVEAAFENGNEEVSVIVLLENDLKTISRNEEEKKEAIQEKQETVLEELNLEEKQVVLGLFTEEKEFELQRRYETINAFAGEVTEEGLAKLRRNPRVESVVVNNIRHIFLSDSVPLINADDAGKVSAGGYNLTGEGQTVCIIDTGVDYNHSALGGSFGNTVIAGYDFYNNDSDPMDDQGHGTHVAGIVASADATYQGVAPKAKLAAVKVCNSAGSCQDDDVLAGFEWCTNNAAAYNISVISISLGGGKYSSYCDMEPDFAPYALVVNDAVSKGITVVAATGNSGSGGIAGPACLQNSTRVTATTKSDVMASYASRHSFFTDTVAAPGSSITSLKMSGGTTVLSGTSMAAPHVAGAVAVMKQYWKLAYNKAPTSEQVEQKIISSGKLVYDDSTGQNYARVDVLALLQPVLMFTNAPANGSVLNATLVDILVDIIVTSDVDLLSAVLEWSYPNGSMVNITMSAINGGSTQFTSNLTGLEKGVHRYRVYGLDAAGMSGASVLNSFVVDNVPPSVMMQAPAEGANFSGGVYIFRAAAADAHSSISSVLFNVTDGNSSLVLPASGSEGIWSASLNLSALAEGSHTVAAWANDSFGNVNRSSSVSFNLDKSGPVVALLSPEESKRENSSSAVAFRYTVTDAWSSVASCSLYLNSTVNDTATAPAIIESEAQLFNKTLLDGDYTWMISCADTLGNAGNSPQYFLTMAVAGQSSNQTANETTNQTIVVNQTVTLHSPLNGYLSSDSTVLFNCSVDGDNNQSNITLYGSWNGGWRAKESKQLTNAPSATFVGVVPEGNHRWNCLAVDDAGNAAFASANNSFTIDLTKPILSSIGVSDVDENSAEANWNTNEISNTSVQYGASQALGTVKAADDDATSHSMTLSNLNASTTYYYAVASCDNAGNCNTSATLSFTTEVEEESSDSSDEDSDDPSSASSSASDSSSGGGSSDSKTDGEEGDGEAGEGLALEGFPDEVNQEAAPEQQQNLFSQTIHLFNGQPGEVTFSAAGMPVTKIKISAAVDKEVTVTVNPLSALPEGVAALDDVYMFLEITADLEPQEVDTATVTFTVPAEWLNAHNYSKGSVALQTYEDNRWAELDTSLVSEDATSLTYESEVNHFSYFAITASQSGGFGSLITGLFSAIIPDDINPKEYVLFGLVLLTALLLVAYVLVSRRERYS